MGKQWEEKGKAEKGIWTEECPWDNAQNMNDPVKPNSKRTNVRRALINISFPYIILVKIPDHISRRLLNLYFIHGRNQITALTTLHGKYAIRPQLAPLRHPFLRSAPLMQHCARFVTNLAVGKGTNKDSELTAGTWEPPIRNCQNRG